MERWSLTHIGQQRLSEGREGWDGCTTEEGKTAVAPLNLTGWIYSVRAEGPAWSPLRWGENDGV